MGVTGPVPRLGLVLQPAPKFGIELKPMLRPVLAIIQVRFVFSNDLVDQFGLVERERALARECRGLPCLVRGTVVFAGSFKFARDFDVFFVIYQGTILLPVGTLGRLLSRL